MRAMMPGGVESVRLGVRARVGDGSWLAAHRLRRELVRVAGGKSADPPDHHDHARYERSNLQPAPHAHIGIVDLNEQLGPARGVGRAELAVGVRPSAAYGHLEGLMPLPNKGMGQIRAKA